MDDLLILLGAIVAAVVLFAPIGVIVLFRRVRSLADRVAELEKDAPVAASSAQPWGPVAAPQANAQVATAPVDVPAEDAPQTVSTGDVETGATTGSEGPPKTFVFNAERLAGGITWLRENWFLGVAAVSLALAGIFLVQYGAEQGLLTPFARVMGALGLGAALIAGGEGVRRRYGDESGTMRALPSTLSGAGIVTLFAAVLSARHLYGMLPSDLAFYALVGVAVIAIAIGWFYGPFLAAVGVIGALGAPFVVGGSSDAPHLFFYYFALIVVMALAIDTVRRWAWVSVLALVLGFAATWVLLASGAAILHALAFAILVTIAATAIPVRRIWPDHFGAAVTDTLLKLTGRSKAGWPEFPTRIAAGTLLAATALATLATLEASAYLENWIALWCIFALGALTLGWMYRAEALADLSLVAPVVLIALVPAMAATYAPVYAEAISVIEADAAAEGATADRSAFSILTGMIAALSLLGFWRSVRGVRWSLIWAMATAFALPAMIGALELFWAPSAAIGAYPWAGHAMAGAVLMTVLAERSARRWPADLRPAALYAMSALALISFALTLVLSQAALSVALAVMIAIAALIDRRFDMALLGVFIQLGVAVLGWRLIVDPGIPWASWWNTPLWEVLLGTAIPIALLALSWWIIRPRRRVGAQLALESAVWTFAAILVLILLERWLRSDIDSFWGLSLAGSVMLITCATQLYRWRKGQRLGWLRIALATVLGLLATATLLIALVLLSPLQSWGVGEVKGPLILDTIAIGYLVPAAVLAAMARKLGHVHKWLRVVFAGTCAVLLSAYVGLEIRWFWQGSEMHRSVVSQGELYSYTVAMMLAAVGLLLFAFQRRSPVLRKLAMAGIALTIAKVFLLDMSGLTGLIRVASFLGLGLALTGLAWLSRAMSARWDDGADTPLDEA